MAPTTIPYLKEAPALWCECQPKSIVPLTSLNGGCLSIISRLYFCAQVPSWVCIRLHGSVLHNWPRAEYPDGAVPVCCFLLSHFAAGLPYIPPNPEGEHGTMSGREIYTFFQQSSCM